MTAPLVPVPFDRPVRTTVGLPLGLALIWLLAYLVWSLIAPPFETAAEAVIDEAALLPVRVGIALTALWIALRDDTAPAVRVSYQLLGWSFVLSTIANMLRVLGGEGMPLPTGLALTIAVPQAALMLTALWQLARLRPDGATADWLDAAAIVVALFLLAAHFIAGGNPFDSLLFGARRWLFLLYLAADITAVLLVATAWFRRPDGLSRIGLGSLTLGFAIIAVADLVYDHQIQTRTWTNGGALDATVAVGFLLLFVGLDRQRRFRTGDAEPRPSLPGDRHVVAPFAILAATVPMLQLAWAAEPHHSHLAFHVTGVVALLVLLLVRQHLAREQLLRLGRERMAADARFRSLVQRSSDAILQMGTDQVIQWASPSAGELSGTIPAHLVGRRVSDLAHPADRDRLTTFLANASQPFARNSTVRWRLGRPEHWHDVESVVTDLTTDPDVRSIVLNTRNVSERVRLEQQLRQSQKLEAIGRLAGGIAHDFNNILAAIISHAQLVRESLPAGDLHVSDLHEIEQTAQRGAVLTRRLLSFSRPEVGEMSARSLTAVVRGMEPMLRRLLVGQVELALEVGEEHLWVRSAEGQVEQILMNLAINARDAMSEGGTVRVKLRVHTVRPGAAVEGELPGRWAELSVTDTGVGMDDATLGRLFEPFFTTKPSGLGTGLGLTTVRGIVRAVGGQIFATSTPGEGSTFRVLIPLTATSLPPEVAAVRRTPVNALTAIPAGSPVSPVQSMTPVAPVESVAPDSSITPTTPASVVVTERRSVLVVDDEVALRYAMERLLARTGYQVASAGNAHEALDWLDANGWRVDLVITDMVMPRMGGREFVQRLRARAPSLPVICMSGHMEWGEDAADESAAPWSPEHLLAKPFAFPEFLQRVREALDAPVAGAGTQATR